MRWHNLRVIRALPPLAALLVACVEPEERTSGRMVTEEGPVAVLAIETTEVPRPPLEEGLFPLASARISESPAPPRFAAPLPATVEAFRGPWTAHPPRVHVEHRLCAGDAETQGRWEEAVRAASDAGADSQELRDTYGGLVRWCGDGGQCDWAARLARGGGPTGEAAWPGLMGCRSAEVESLFAASTTPDELVVEYWSDRWDLRGESFFAPRLAAALEGVARSGDLFATRRAAATLGAADDDSVTERLLAVHDALEHGDAREALLTGLAKSSHPRAVLLVKEHCESAGASARICDDRRSGRSAELPEEPLPDDCLGAPRLRTELGGDGWEAPTEVASCLRTLAGRDRPAAVDQARRLLGWEIRDPSLAELARALDGFPLAGSLEAHLRSLGLLAEERRPEGDYLPISAGEILMASGQAFCLDAETGRYPNEHDGLLAKLAAHAGPPLDAALFEETAPPVALADGSWLWGERRWSAFPDGAEPGAPYRLRAYLDGLAFELDAQDFGDWYDLEQTLGLLNAMAARSETDLRFTTLPTDGQTACVLAALAPAVRQAIAEGLITLGTAGSAREQGLAFEEQALRHLDESGSGP